MELFFSCSLALLETTFIIVGLLILHGLRNLIGKGAFYFALGFLLVFTQLVSATELKITLDISGGDFYVAQTVFFLPYLTALIVVYVTEGTLAAQRLIIGAMATLGLFVYLSYLTAIQCDWVGYTISQGPSADSLNYLLRQSQRTMAGSILAQTLDLFLIPIFYQRLRNLNCRLFICVIGSLMLTQIVDNFVYVTICYWGSPQWLYQINSSYLAKSILSVWLSVFAAIYISRIEKEAPGEGRNTLDIIIAFFGGYGRARILQQKIQDWVDRYKMVVDNASDMILLCDDKGVILEANFAAVRALGGKLRNEIIGQSFHKIVTDANNHPIEWRNYRQAFKVEDTSIGSQIIKRLECHVSTSSDFTIDLDVAITSTKDMDGKPMFIVLGRDVTERKRLEREQEELRDQLAHTQRLESIGQLAGGVAHDFNNYLHAIQGHLDLIKYMHEVDEEVERHLEKVDDMTEKAGQLTQQLLGFARKGKYHEKVLNLGELVQKTVELFTPNTQEGINFKAEVPSEKLYVRGDAVQLQQVFLNLLINARDAVKIKGENGQIKMALHHADYPGIPWNPPGSVSIPKNEYYCVVVKDNGEGIDPKVINHVFEPFFTTKPRGEGTGMGLAMAYGTISNHKGWINVQSRVGKGSMFYVFLPRSFKVGRRRSQDEG